MSFIGKVNKNRIVVEEKLEGQRLLFYVQQLESSDNGMWVDSHDFFRGVFKSEQKNIKLAKANEKYLGKTFSGRTGSYTIVEVLDGNKVVVEFDNGYSTITTVYHALAGSVRNPTGPSVCGIGYVGIGQYNAKTSIVAYSAWTQMLRRITQSGKIGLAEEWHNFQNFAAWYIHETNIRKRSDIGFVVEKDILSPENGKIYSPTTALLVPSEINQLFKTTKENKETALPPGVVLLSKGLFKVSISNDNIKTILGTFENPLSASSAYWKAKAEIWITKADEYRDYLCDRGYNGILQKANLILVKNIIPHY